MEHYTRHPAWVRSSDPGDRANDIAEREAEKVWQATGSYEKWSRAWDEIYDSTLREFQQTEGREERWQD